MFIKVIEYFSRKFVLAALSLVGSFVLVWYEKDVGGWAMAMGVVLGFYNGANVFQTYVESKANVNTTKA